MKRFFSRLFLEGFLVYALMIHQVAAQQVGLLWQIDAPHLKPSYLFGTIHSEDPRVTQLPPQVDQCFKHASSVSLEILMDLPTLQKVANIMLLGQESSLDKLIGNSLYSQVLKALQAHKISEPMAKKLKPWAVVAMLSMPPSVTGEYLDAILYKRAMELHIPPYGLEKVEEQFEAFEALSLSEQLILLKDALNALDEIPQLFNKLHELYLKRDLSALMTFSQAYTLAQSSDPIAVKTFYKRLIDDRNVRMVKHLLPRLQEGNAFIAVGALHLPGERGLLKLLQKLGYRIKALY